MRVAPCRRRFAPPGRDQRAEEARIGELRSSRSADRETRDGYTVLSCVGGIVSVGASEVARGEEGGRTGIARTGRPAAGSSETREAVEVSRELVRQRSSNPTIDDDRLHGDLLLARHAALLGETIASRAVRGSGKLILRIARL